MTSNTAWNSIQKRLDAIDKPKQSLKLCDDPEIRDRYQAALQAAARAEETYNSLSADADKDARAIIHKRYVEASAALVAAQEEYDAHTVTLTFRALDRSELRKVQEAHPPSEEDEALGRDFDFETFAPELIAAASVDGMPVEYAAQAMKTWSLGDSEDLWNAAWSIQRRKRTDLGKG